MNNTVADIHAELLSAIERYIRFASAVEPFLSASTTAQYMLFARSCNAFSAAATLCLNGFFVDSYSSARTGLEAGWLSLILRSSEERAMEWLTMVPSDTSLDKAEKRYRNTFGSPAWIRKEVSANDREQRDNIYQVLSIQSHANVASAFFVRPSANDPNDLCLYAPGPLDSDEHRCKYMNGILYCLKCLLREVQSQCDCDLGVTWNYDEMSLFNIAGIGYPDKDTIVKVVPQKVNAAYQAMVLLKLAKLRSRGTT